MKKKIQFMLLTMVTTALISSVAEANSSFSQIEVKAFELKSGTSVPIHNGSVLGTVNKIGGSGPLELRVRQNLVGTKPIVLRVSSSNSLNTARAKVSASNYYPQGYSDRGARGYVSISGSW